MARRAKIKDDNSYIEEMQLILMSIAKDEKAGHKERIDAAKEAAKLLYIKHKVKGGDDNDNFFRT